MPYVFAGGVFALCVGHAVAEICAYENNGGQTLYTNVSPGPDWKKRQCFATIEPPSPPAAKSAAATPAARSALPRVSPERQRERDAMRRKVIEDELATESKLLEEARAAYANGAPPALPEEFLNPQKYAARIAQLRESVSLHERNVDALKKEIAKM
ncbi:MAG: hypothetical protein LBI35_09610 [Burkholderiales bacterium]|nr:hypothetical protein [Burkholderiales bacterium]